MDDQTILKLFEARDEAALNAFRDKYGALTRHIIRNVLSDERDVEECENGLLAALWNAIPPAKPQNLRAYAAKAARNEALKRARANCAAMRGGRALPLDELAEVLPSLASPQSEAEARALGEAISRFLSKQSAKKRGVFIRRYFMSDTLDDIAQAYSMSGQAVSLMLFRIKKALKSYLKEEGFTDE